jgi:hypothetical protein
MATKRGKRSTKRVKSLRSKSVSAGKAKTIRGGGTGLKEGATQKIAGITGKISHTGN